MGRSYELDEGLHQGHLPHFAVVVDIDRWCPGRGPVDERTHERAGLDLANVGPVEQPHHAVAGQCQVEHDVTVCIGRGQPAAHHDRLALGAAGELPDVHHGALRSSGRTDHEAGPLRR
jgi:hypothetical protein